MIDSICTISHTATAWQLHARSRARLASLFGLPQLALSLLILAHQPCGTQPHVTRVIFVSAVRVMTCTKLTLAEGVADKALVISFDRVWGLDVFDKVQLPQARRRLGPCLRVE